MTQPDDALTTSRETRERHVGRVDVLDKVKALALLPDDTHATTEIVADYFEVGVEAIRSAIKDHRDEIEADGYRVIAGPQLKSFKELSGVTSRAPSLALFPRRAVLRVAMLLRDSAVARQVRTYLLDAERSLPDLSTSDGQIEMLSRMLEIAREKKALELANATQAKELESARPKAAYVDTFVYATADATTLPVLAKQLGTTDRKLREHLVTRKVIYRRTVGRRWSESKKRHEPEYEWLPRAGYEAWFTPKDQPDAPRMHNGQPRTTLYVTPVGKTRIAELLRRHPIGGAA